MEKDNIYRADERYHTTVGQMFESIKTIMKNVGEDTPCFYTITLPSDVMRWSSNIVFSREFSNDVVDNLWYYGQAQEMIRKTIENEVNLQLEQKNLTLDDFSVC